MKFVASVSGFRDKMTGLLRSHHTTEPKIKGKFVSITNENYEMVKVLSDVSNIASPMEAIMDMKLLENIAHQAKSMPNVWHRPQEAFFVVGIVPERAGAYRIERREHNQTLTKLDTIEDAICLRNLDRLYVSSSAIKASKENELLVLSWNYPFSNIGPFIYLSPAEDCDVLPVAQIIVASYPGTRSYDKIKCNRYDKRFARKMRIRL